MRSISKILSFFMFMLLFLTLVVAYGSHDSSNVQQYPAKTPLSKKAANLKLGMSKAQAIKLLGSPTWADSDEGIPLTLAWSNGKCNPVVVTFNKQIKVDGWDEGRVECLTSTYTDLPDDQYLCSNPNNSAMCVVNAP